MQGRHRVEAGGQELSLVLSVSRSPPLKSFVYQMLFESFSPFISMCPSWPGGEQRVTR